MATEDERFYSHSGVDAEALARAVAFLGTKGGGSTLTQQLAKMQFSEPATNLIERIMQKFGEWVIAIRLERLYTKEEIIALYLNQLDFLYQAVGINSAARTYFNKKPSSLFTKLFVGSLVMLIFGYLGEAGNMNAMVAFVIAMVAWLYMIQVLYSGEGAAAAKQANPAVQTAYKTMMLIIVVGWAVYPLGYVLGHLVGDTNPASLNIVYNFADFVNKILFGLIIWHAAVTESQGT